MLLALADDILAMRQFFLQVVRIVLISLINPTPWRSHPWGATSRSASQKISLLFVTWSFIFMSSRARHWTLFWNTWSLSTHISHRLWISHPLTAFPSRLSFFLLKCCMRCFNLPLHASCPATRTLSNLVTLMISGKWPITDYQVSHSIVFSTLPSRLVFSISMFPLVLRFQIRRMFFR